MDRLKNLKTEIKSNNPSSPFLPMNTRKNDFQWDQVEAFFLADIIERSAESLSKNQLKVLCKQSFEEVLDDPDQWALLESMYFEGDVLGNISPELLLVSMQSEHSTASDRRLADLLASLRGEEAQSFGLKAPLNFLERRLREVARRHLVHTKPKSPPPPYLPFLAELFRQDLRFITARPQVGLSLIRSFIELYGFLYISQLALNLGEWRAGEPRSKSLYFILEGEKASAERTDVMSRGYASLREPFWNLFPMLTMLETLFPSESDAVRLWEIPTILDSEGADSPVTTRLANFASEFAIDRGIPTPRPCKSAVDWVDELLRISIRQFSQGTNRRTANERVEKGIHERLGASFIKSRGRAGLVLILSQEALLMLTNLSIGEEKRLRIQELLVQFQARGVYFDKQSEQALIEFFERIGNIERMSDSGDAVYVRKTI